MTHMTDNAMFSKSQHGVRPGRSCVQQLLEVIESWTMILNAGVIVDQIILTSQRRLTPYRARGCFSSVLTMGSKEVR